MADATDASKAKARGIFRYSFGDRERAYDPDKVNREFLRACLPEGMEKLYADAATPTEGLPIDQVGPIYAAGCDAATKLAAAARSAFRLEPLDDSGEGVTEAEALDGVNALFSWMAEHRGSPAVVEGSPSEATSESTAPAGSETA